MFGRFFFVIFISRWYCLVGRCSWWVYRDFVLDVLICEVRLFEWIVFVMWDYLSIDRWWGGVIKINRVWGE